MQPAEITLPTLYYVYDPMCSWCYAFSPVWQQLRERLATKVRLQYVLGGLAPDSNQPMPADMRAYIRSQWQKIEGLTTVRFNYDFWQNNIPRRSTYPACRAMLAVRMQCPELEQQACEIIQHWYYQEAKNPSDKTLLQTLAPMLGLDSKAFNTTLDDKNALITELELCQKLKTRSFPSLVLYTDAQYIHIPIDYVNIEPTLVYIKNASRY